MKRTIQNFILVSATALLSNVPTAAFSQTSIVYVDGWSLVFAGWEYNGTSLDLDRNGTGDFNVQWGAFVCTADVPTSACSSSFDVLAVNTNAVLHRFGEATMLRFGETISSTTSSNRIWDDPDNYSRVAGYYFSPRYGTQGYDGPVINAGVGYLGVRFVAADGLHFGWIRLRAPSSNEFGPVVVDWAYESRPNTAILAGDIGSGGQSRQFSVELPDGNSGSLILTRDQLRCELMLNGQFSSAELIRSLRGNGKPIADLGQSVAARTNYTCFFHDVKLSRGEAMQLQHGTGYISIDEGAVIGRVLPID